MTNSKETEKCMPLLAEEGWLRHQSLEQAQMGWSVERDHPVCALNNAAFGDISLMAQPPLLFKEGHTR
jgi:hypothetical protein